MKQLNRYRKVTSDLFFAQSKWVAWFLGILIIIQYVVRYFLPDTREHIGGFIEFSRSSAGIFMLVCGILAVFGFVEYYVQHGLTRKDMFKATALAGAGIALLITVAALLVNGIEYFLARQFPGSDVLSNEGFGGYWLAEAGIYAAAIYLYFLIGWLISIGYYRFGWLIGLAFVALALAAIMLHDFLWGGNSGIPWIPDIPIQAAPLVGTIGSIALAAVLLIAIHGLMKRVAIRM